MAEELATAEEEKQRKREEQARAMVEQLEKEKQRLAEEKPRDKSTPVEIITWVQMASEAEEKQKKAVEEVGSAYQGVGIGSGWEVSEGKAMRMVEITTHFWTAVTEEEKNKLPNKVGVVADLIEAKRRAEGRGVWAIKPAVDTQVCNNEITWALSKVLRGTMEEEVKKTLHDMVLVSYRQEKLRDTWITNRKSIAVFI